MKMRSVTTNGPLPAGWSRTGLVLAGLVGLVPAAAAQSGYGSPTLYATGGTAPLGVVLGDVNGDGRPDLVAANQGTDNVSVLLAQAAPVGTYGAATTYTLPGSGTSNAPSPTGVALGDVNGDGRLDLITGNQGTGTVGVLLNSATTPGTFATPAVYSSGGTDSNLLVLGDVNGDGRLDIAIANSGSSTVGVLLNSATTPGTFAAPALYAVGGTGPVGLALGDVNGDGRPDLVTGNQSGTVGVLLNLATAPGTFAAAVSYASGGTSSVGVTLGDVNSDGRPDIVVANNGSNTVGVLLGSATAGTFGPASTYACARPNLIALGDVNGDGRPDLVAGNENGGTVSVLTGLAATPGTFGVAATYSSGGTGPIGVALGDVNGDARRDIVVTNYQSNTVGVLLNTYIVLASTTAQATPEVSIYPNPAHEAFTVQLPATASAGPVQAELLNALGQVVRRQQALLPAGGPGLAIDAAGLAPGYYFVRLRAGDIALTRSLLLQ